MGSTKTNDEQFNADVLNAPDWLNKQLFTKVIRKYENNNSIEILNLSTSPVTMIGDHYTTVMFRFHIEYRLPNADVKVKSVIVKTMPEYEGHKKELLEDTKIFETEIGVYTEVLPRIEQILRDAGEELRIAPPCLDHGLHPKKYIVFEDIVPKGYVVLRDRQMNLEEVKASYYKLAKWHAVTYRIALDEPHYFDKYDQSQFTMPDSCEDTWAKHGIERFIKMLKTQPDLVEYVPYFEALDGENLNRTIQSLDEYRCNPKANALYTLCHGDFHMRNLMFKYENNDNVNSRLKDLLLFDFQSSYVGPIANDIIYSIVLCLTPDLRKNHLEELIYFYFKTFQDTLKQIHFNGEMPKLVDLYKQRMDHIHFEIFLFTTFLPVLYMMFEGDGDFGKMSPSHEDHMQNLYFNEKFIAEVREILPKYLHNGFLEA